MDVGAIIVTVVLVIVMPVGILMSMAGLDDWSFPHEWAMVEENRVVARWMNRLPGRRPDGSHYEVPGYSLMIYAGGGRFSHEEDTLNMVHVVEVMGECGWKPPLEFNMPPRNPRR